MACARDTWPVATFGYGRQRATNVLNAAFAQGLLSEQTHAHRLGLVLGPQLVDPQRVVGDLTLRSGRSRLASTVRRAGGSLAESLRTTAGVNGPSMPTLLLALDRAESDRLLVGRHPRCDVVVGDPSVSRRHAQLTFRDGVWVLQDLASTNGTRVNGKLVGRTALHTGDVLELGVQMIQID